MIRRGAESEPPEDANAHGVTLALVDPLPPEVDAGADLTARVRASCASACDLRGASLRVVSAGSTLCEGTLDDSVDGSGYEASLAWKAPPRAGEWSGAVVFSSGPISHEEASLDVRCRVMPHATSMAVWSTGSPLKGGVLPVSVGVKCATGCSLAGQLVEILDESGAKVAEATLERSPRPGTSNLYAVEVPLVAPDRAGVFHRSVRFASRSLDLPHESAAASFTFRCLDPPDHTVTVRIAFEGIAPHKEGIEVRVGPYVGFTDEHGVARVGVSKGAHAVSFWRADLEPASTHIEVAGDTGVDLVAGPRRFVDEDADRAWM